MSMGLAGMAGAAGAGDALATLFDQRLRAAESARRDQQQQIQQQEFQQNQARLDALMRITAQEKADTVAQHLKTETDANRTRLNAELTALPQDQTISGGTHDALIAGGVLPERMNPTPITPEAPPPSLAATDQPPSPLPGTIANSPAPAARTFQRIPTQAESAQQNLLALYSVGSKEHTALAYELATNKNAPGSMFPKAGDLKETANGIVRIGADNSVTPIPNTVPYHPTAQGAQPQIFTDKEGNAHAIQFVGGKAVEIPIPSGLTKGGAGGADKPLPYQAAENIKGLNVADVEGTKVLKALHASGLDQSNDPADPRWEQFVVTTLKMAPGDFTKADIQQRTAFVNAALTRNLMGGRPSQYVAQLLQQHLPQGSMTGQQLAHVLTNVLEQTTENRKESANLLKKSYESVLPVSGQYYQQYLDELSGSGSGGGDALAELERRRAARGAK